MEKTIESGMITFAFKLKTPFENVELLKQFNHVVRFAYNRYADGMEKDSEVSNSVKSVMNHINLLDASFISSAVKKAKFLWKVSKDNGSLIFGGKGNWYRYVKGLISKDEFEKNRLLPLLVIGAHNDHGNRKFALDLKNNRIVFKKSKSEHYDLEFHESSKCQKRLLDKLQELYDKDKCLTCFTIQLSEDKMWLTFDESEIGEKTFTPKKGRTASIDMNPNCVALVIQDENGVIIDKELFSIKQINDFDNPKRYENRENKKEWRKHLNNKRKHETLQISKKIINLCIHYKVETFVIEDLTIRSKSIGQNKKLNKLCLNSWQRNILFNNLQKHCNLNQIEFKPVPACYSSVKGQLEHDDEVDSIAAAIEIGKRKNIDVKELKNMWNAEADIGGLSNRWKNEIGSMTVKPTWKNILLFLKKKFKNPSYRNFFSESNPNIGVSYSLESVKSHVKVYTFI